MSVGVPHRPAESRVLADFLASSATGPSVLVLEGEAGIGKTTVWQAAVEEARARGMTVLAARPSAAEATLAHGSVADLLRGAPPDLLSRLPLPQRRAVRQVLQMADEDEGATDQQAIGAALLSVVHGLATEGPVILAIDDAQWLDASSAAAIAFAVRRLTGRIGVLTTVRTGSADEDQPPWLDLARPAPVTRIVIGPLRLGDLHAVLSERLTRPFPRPIMERIHRYSRGNPFYAVELARVVDAGTELLSWPATLGELVRGRLDGVGEDVRDLLLAVASLAEPTVELVQATCGPSEEHVLALVEDAEARGLIVVEGNRLRFAHPLLAAAVGNRAGPAGRRRMHRRLAAVVQEPEQHARHLALSAVRGDPVIFGALDAAAVLAATRGAPSAAAELLELAIGLGGGSSERRLQVAVHHFNAGDTERARRGLERLVGELPSGTLRARTTSLLGLVRLHDDSFVDAAALLEAALDEVGDDLRLLVEILLRLAYAEVNTGRLDAALQHVAAAVTGGERLGDQELLSQALALRVTLRFMRGHGLDEWGLAEAVRLEPAGAWVPIAFRARTQAALLRAWTGELDAAARELGVLRRDCFEHGQESDLVFIDFHLTLVDVWRGELGAASATAEGAMERALQLNGDVPLAVARSLRALVAAYVGDVQRAREEAEESLAIYRRCGWTTLVQWPLATLAFLHVSTGDFPDALSTLQSLLVAARGMYGLAEIISSSFVADALEALVQVGRLDEAEALLEPFDQAARRLDRPWALAVASRARAMQLAAVGSIDAACAEAERAMAAHGRVRMPFERARTQLLLGQLQRRRRKKEQALASLGEALRAFEQLGTVLWAERARGELSRVAVGTGAGDHLTPTERRVAELAASGMTNREVASELFISSKTVEANLARVYRKLDIRSRAELGRRIGPPSS